MRRERRGKVGREREGGGGKKWKEGERRELLPAPLALCAPGAWAVALIKPQFEAGRDAVGRGGVVRDASTREAVCSRIRDWFASRPGWRVLGLCESPITGPAGNVEYPIAAERNEI